MKHYRHTGLLVVRVTFAVVLGLFINSITHAILRTGLVKPVGVEEAVAAAAALLDDKKPHHNHNFNNVNVNQHDTMIHNASDLFVVSPEKYGVHAARTPHNTARDGTSTSFSSTRSWRIVHQIWIPFHRDGRTGPSASDDINIIQKNISAVISKGATAATAATAASDMPERWRAGPAAWQAALPGWKYWLWTRKKAQSFLATHYAWYLPVWESYPYEVQRVDALRYFIMYHYGGVYADLDVAPVSALDATEKVMSLLARAPVTLVITRDLGLTNALMAATRARHPFYLHLMLRLHARGLSSTWFSWLGRHMHIMSTTSPLFLWLSYGAYHAPDAAGIALLAPDQWNTCSLCDSSSSSSSHIKKTQQHGTRAATFIHVKGNSWHKLDSTFWAYGVRCYGVFIVSVPLLFVVLDFRHIKAIGRTIHALCLSKAR